MTKQVDYNKFAYETLDNELKKFIHDQATRTKIRHAYEFAQQKHAGQTRKSGAEYIVHPL